MNLSDRREAGPPVVLWLLLGIFVLVVAVFHETAASLVAIWSRTGTFGHGFLVPPIVAWLVWRRRDRLAAVPLRPRPVWLVALVLLGFAWYAGRLGHVLILEQGAFALMVPVMVAALLGTAMVRALLFPLFFLLFAVPAGDWIIPQLIDVTATLTVHALNLSGVPVVREGPYLRVPGAEWIVTDACSGFRYLVASFAIGCLYAHLQFRTRRYQLLIVGISLLLPIVANGCRAYMIVMLGYLSDMKIAVGVDHILYGWVLFALFTVLLLWIGSRLSEPEAAPSAAPAPPPVASRPVPRRAFGLVAIASLVVLLIWPLSAARIEAATSDGRAVALTLPARVGDWVAIEDRIAAWRPSYSGATADLGRAYRSADGVAGVYLAYYEGRNQNGDLLNSMNTIVAPHDSTWRWAGEASRTPPRETGSLHVKETRVAGQGQRLLLWHYYWLGGSRTTNPFVAELLDLRGRLLSGRYGSALVVYVAPYGATPDAAVRTLEAFQAALGPHLDAILARGATTS